MTDFDADSPHADSDPDVRYRACLARDARFDGRFVVGVMTTGIYCRPVCPARKPHPHNCRFFDQPAAAEQAGFRPCLRCRPERATQGGRLPGDELNGQLAEAAARAIDQGALEHGSLTELAGHIGVSPRHLRRLFQQVHGVSPQAWAQTRRLLAARRLLADTSLPITEVAAAAGFNSLRRFNALFRKRYGMPPSALRRQSAAPSAATLGLELAYRPPLAWSAMLDFLSRRRLAGVEALDDGHYARVIRHRDGRLGWLSVTALEARCALHLTIPADQADRCLDYLRLARRLFDLDARIDLIDERLGALAATTPGIRVPGGADGFEVAVRTVVGQVISLERARALLDQLVAHYGEPLDDPLAPAGLSHAFPTAARLAAVEPTDLVALGLTRMKAGAIWRLAQAVAAGELRLEPTAPLDTTLAALQSIPGIGDWTAQMVAMRALDWPDAWPGGDLVLRRCLAELGAAADPADWSPWRAYAAMQLWHRAVTPSTPSTSRQEAAP